MHNTCKAGWAIDHYETESTEAAMRLLIDLIYKSKQKSVHSSRENGLDHNLVSAKLLT